MQGIMYQLEVGYRYGNREEYRHIKIKSRYMDPQGWKTLEGIPQITRVASITM